jgi:hypothetical protein
LYVKPTSFFLLAPAAERHGGAAESKSASPRDSDAEPAASLFATKSAFPAARRIDDGHTLETPNGLRDLRWLTTV